MCVCIGYSPLGSIPATSKSEPCLGEQSFKGLFSLQHQDSDAKDEYSPIFAAWNPPVTSKDVPGVPEQAGQNLVLFALLEDQLAISDGLQGSSCLVLRTHVVIKGSKHTGRNE